MMQPTSLILVCPLPTPRDLDGEYRSNAKKLNDLIVQNEERETLWRSLRERAENEQLYKTDLPEVDIPPDVLMALLGIKESQPSYDVKEEEW